MKNKLYILIGVPGVGKSTIANKLKNKNTICLSSDDIREEYIEKGIIKISYMKYKKL